MKKALYFFIISLTAVLLSDDCLFAHCDTMDGPVIADARKALENRNVNYVLKWVQPANEDEIRSVFKLAEKVRALGPDAKDLADKYFFETLVRIHRAGEGVPFTGVKPEGTPVDEKILAADKSIEERNLKPLEGLFPAEKMPELTERFNRVLSLINFDVNDVAAGRKYIEAYVSFFHFAEGEEEGHAHGSHAGHAGHLTALAPWLLAALFFVLSLVFGIKYFKSKK